MSQSQILTIYLKESGNSYNLQYYYNQNSTFDDLLEFFSYNYPDLKICPCYKIEYYNKNNIYVKVNMTDKVNNYMSSYTQYQLIKENNECNCDEIIKNYFWKPKLEIIKTISEYSKEVNNLEKEINELKQIIENKEKIEMNLKKKIEKLEYENEKLREEINGRESENQNFIDFYDIIVDIKSMKGISQGWEIKMNEYAKQKYEEFKKENAIKIGVIGNANKGKSFLLSKISKISLRVGDSIRTEGLSIKYPVLDNFKNRKIVLLDSAGLETPILENENKAKNPSEDEIKEKDYFKEKSREKLVTKLFLQNYIINNSDILIIVVGILTYSEQKMLNRIRTEFLKIRNHNPLFIIHNLMTYKTIEQVEEYINDILLKSATFDLTEGHKLSFKAKNSVYYFERNKDKPIFHLIFAHDGSDAGNYYNQFTLDFLEQSYQNVIELTNFDVIETIKDSFVEISKDILEKTENSITKESFDNSNKYLIKLSNTNEITLKKCFIDELGYFNLKGNGFEPNYNCYKKGNKIIVRVEISGNSELSASLYYDSLYNIIRVSGEKRKDKVPEKNDDTIFSNREFGKFYIDIPLSHEYSIKNEEPLIMHKNGLIIIEFEFEEPKKNFLADEL